MRKKSWQEIAQEIRESIEKSNKHERRLMSKTFWREEFRVKKKTSQVVARISRILDENNIKFSVKSGAEFGKEKPDDWIILGINDKVVINGNGDDNGGKPPEPPREWFECMQTRIFESEKEVEVYFVLPLLEKLGYKYDDIVLGYPVILYDGVKKRTKEADIVIFNGASHNYQEGDDVLLVIEAKSPQVEIKTDHIGQARSYARELIPAFYIVTNGEKVIVFRFNGLKCIDEHVLEFDRSVLHEMWPKLYKFVSKEAATEQKAALKELIRVSAS
ncbi:MAG: type I restriction enzyme HsdR N-terminal domain-containing protein [Methanothrix sp.]|uniref:type I restriction enzyme HsdR N-terminal domain-containing protein n=1 Tax=Methanothrix sp. TaxID=90426 RepID=UPI0019A083CE|nr:type I restriction enzyme HsdR N-terminal domain-containing protein [Methanothrix sp.]MBC7080411.1 type I restriction enzyme HsdR N-terminal domain-containing protein [Methanothrix sp.]NPU86921.1 hypothetical protein [Methanothrix sp.]